MEQSVASPPRLAIDIVEDEMLIAGFIERLLRSHGYEVRNLFDHAEAALTALREDPPGLMLLDLNLRKPGDGLEILKVARSHTPDMKVLVVTGCMEEEVIAEAKSLGAVAVLEKNANPEQLLKTVSDCLPAYPVEKRIPIEEAKRVLEENIGGIVQVAEWAEVMGYNRKSFLRAFRSHFNRPPHTMLIEARKKRLIHLLQLHPDSSAFERAKEMGFSNDVGLYRFIWQNFDCTVNELRSRADE